MSKTAHKLRSAATVAESPRKAWQRVHLGDVCELLNGFAFDSAQFSPESGTPLLRIRDLRTGNASIRYRGTFEPQYLVVPGDLLIGMDGEFRCYKWTGAPALLNQRVCKLVPHRERLDADFLRLSINRYLADIERGTAYTTVKHLSSKQVLSIQLPLPPLYEQERMAARLNAQMAVLNDGREAAAARLQASRVLARTVVNAAFDASKRSQWPVALLEGQAEIVGGVTLGRRLEAGTTRQVPYLRVANVKDGYLALDDIKQTPATEAEIKKLLLRVGDLVLTEGGDPDKLGRGTHWRGEIAECIHQNHIFRVRLPADRYSPSFVAWQMGSAYGKAYFLAHAKRTTGIATINRTVLGRFPLLRPPLEVQRQIVSEIERALETVDRLTKLLEEELQALTRMPAVLLRQAFNGKT